MTRSPVSDLCRKLGISNATFYKWRSQFDGMDTSLMTRAAPSGAGISRYNVIARPTCICRVNQKD
ncbi:hypothetical protein CSQ95_28470 [Janthinobacterium sp. BJB304]|nr:hypothetical protein CSQ95_28470 [Janthinobacterium sp. BJB304]